jgi:hypothetical protein
LEPVDDCDDGAVASVSTLTAFGTPAAVAAAPAVASSSGTSSPAAVASVTAIATKGAPGASSSAGTSSARNLDIVDQVVDLEEYPVAVFSPLSLTTVVYGAEGLDAAPSIVAVAPGVKPAPGWTVSRFLWFSGLRIRGTIRPIGPVGSIENDRDHRYPFT